MYLQARGGIYLILTLIGATLVLGRLGYLLYCAGSAKRWAKKRQHSYQHYGPKEAADFVEERMMKSIESGGYRVADVIEGRYRNRTFQIYEVRFMVPTSVPRVRQKARFRAVYFKRIERSIPDFILLYRGMEYFVRIPKVLVEIELPEEPAFQSIYRLFATPGSIEQLPFDENLVRVLSEDAGWSIFVRKAGLSLIHEKQRRTGMEITSFLERANRIADTIEKVITA